MVSSDLKSSSFKSGGAKRGALVAMVEPKPVKVRNNAVVSQDDDENIFDS